ncbi:MAG TPA: OsmC family protein [Chitinophagaceae bacterium]|nr:OsmC family protein [Chitinophagaceae bacterium]
MSTKTITHWQKDQQFRSYHGKHEIKIDGKRENGFGAKALLLSATAACSAIDIVDILKKMRVEFSEFEIETEAEQTEEHPRVFKDIHITYKIRTNKANEEKVKRAIELSLDKYCGVSAMLRKNSPIHYKLQLL